jgi:hypothetical protein
LEVAASSFVAAFEGIDLDKGTVKLDVLTDAFKSFDLSNTNREFILADWQFDAQITAIAQNPIQPIVYIGLSNGFLIRLNLGCTECTSQVVLPEDLSNFSEEELATNFGTLVRTDSEITALLPLTNGVVIGATHEEGDGQVYFLLDSLSAPSRIASPREMGRVHKFQARGGFLYTVSDDANGGAPRFFITRILTNSIGTFSTPTSLTGLSGDYVDFVINRATRLLIATNRGDIGTVFSYRLSPTQNSASPLFNPWESFVDPADGETVFNLSNVQTLALGDLTSSDDTDEVLYIGTSDRLYAVETQRQFTSRQELLWSVSVANNVSSFEVASVGSTFTGFTLFATADSTFNYIDGRNRSASDQLPNEIVRIGSAIKSTIYSEPSAVPDPNGFGDIPRIVNLYASDAIYFTAILN